MSSIKAFFSKKNRVAASITGTILVAAFALIFGPYIYAQFQLDPGSGLCDQAGYGYGYGYGYENGYGGGTVGYGYGYGNCQNGGGQATLTVTISHNPGDGQGRIVTTDGHINCHANGSDEPCQYTYTPQNQTVTLKAIPDAGSNFTGTWSGDCSGDNPTCVLVMNTSHTVNAHFSLNNPGGGGGGPGGGGGSGGTGGGSGGSSGGSGGSTGGGTTPGGSVLGDNTGTNPGQVLGDSTGSLPRTGSPLSAWLLVLIAGALPFAVSAVKSLKLKK